MEVPTSIRTEIIPDRVTIVRKHGPDALDLKAICIFAATGFFLGGDTYYANEVALQPATDYELDQERRVRSATRYWHWRHAPREMSLAQATDEFAHVFERITREQTSGRRVVLPLSGGLDSRTQAVALRGNREVQTYSYGFANSFDETAYGQRIADRQGFEFRRYEIPDGYLWRVIDELARLNECYADFTHPRQMAVIDQLRDLGDMFFLGHWGDVLFDDMGVSSTLPVDEQVAVVVGKILKRGGMELASALWQTWGLAGSFDEFLRDRISTLLREIDIDDANARIRAFKSMYWAPRWTTANLVTFSSRRPIALPYYHAEMCKFICTVPERHLARRQIQIEYIKRFAPSVARITWQSYDPLDLYSYKHYYSRRMIPYRAVRRLVAAVRERWAGQPLVTRNWELQFLGESNAHQLRAHLLEHRELTSLVPRSLVEQFYARFCGEDRVKYAHPVSMLLTLSMFARTRRDRSISLV